ncbi:hypothetical protein FKM82_008390 [Ascaphus truei]
MSSHETFRMNLLLDKKQKQNKLISRWINMKPSKNICYNSNGQHFKQQQHSVSAQEGREGGREKIISTSYKLD